MSASLCLCALLFWSPGSVAEEDHVNARRLREAGSILPFETILRQVLAERGGRVLEVGLEQTSGGYIYEIEILDHSGVVWEIEVDAVTGHKMKEQREE